LLKEDPAFSLNQVANDFFSVYEGNPHVADTLARLKPGACSGIIRTGSGFYVVRLDHATKNLITTKTQYERLWSKVERFYTNRTLDSLTVSYARRVMEECTPTISGEALKAIFSRFPAATRQSQFAELNEKGTKEIGNVEVALPEGSGNESLVRSTCDNFTIKEFAAWYSYRRFKIDFSKLTTSTLQSVKDLIFTMVRDKRMIKVARSKGYGDDPNVQFEMNEWKSKLSYWKQKSAALKQPSFTEDEVRSFYAKNKHRYEKDAKGLKVGYGEARNKVENDLTLFEYNKALFHYLNSLGQKYPVRVNEALLRSLQVSDENLSKKIDVMILKKGGTLPRRAFPSIDNEWQFYQ
jgi:hypothetical protein